VTAETTPDRWTGLPDGAGSVLAVAGEIRVAAQLSRLRGWRGLVPLWLVEVPEQNPARPTILSDRVCWGPYSINLQSGAVEEVPFALLPSHYLQTAHAWSPDGSVAIAAGRRKDPGRSVPAVAAWRLDPGGPTTLWSGDDVPPVAVAIDGDVAVVGHRDPVVHAAGGGPATTLPAPTPPQRIDIRSGRLLLVGSGELSVWDLATGAVLGRAGGLWVDGCLTPDGGTVLAVEMSGSLVRLLALDKLRTAIVDVQETPMTAIATDGDVLFGAFAGLPGLGVRKLIAAKSNSSASAATCALHRFST
jgi:hypothetical protein